MMNEAFLTIAWMSAVRELLLENLTAALFQSVRGRILRVFNARR